VRWISLGVLFAAGIALALLWGDVPDRWVIHWGRHGQPDHWVTKNVAVAVGPLIIGFLIWLLIEATATRVVRRGAEAQPRFPPEMLAVQATLVRACGLGAVAVTAGLALALPLLHLRSPIPIAVGALVGIVGVVGAAMVWAWARTEELRDSGVAIPDGYTGAFYSNRRDTRLWVPKTAGIGWTINFAHPLAWAAMIALVLPLVLGLIAALAYGF